MHGFCFHNVPVMQFIFVISEEVKSKSIKLQKRFDSCVQIPNIRSYRFVPQVKHRLEVKCRQPRIRKLYWLQHFSSSKSWCIFIWKKKRYSSLQLWWNERIEETAEEINDLFIHFFHPHGSRTKLSKLLKMTKCGFQLTRYYGNLH